MVYLRQLDGLRAVAILLVILFHYYYWVEVGWIGVQLFFVLSGFLITSILLETRDYPLSHYLKRFYWRRSLRIFPLYYFYITVFLVSYLVLSVPDNFGQISVYLYTYTYNFFPLIGEFEFDIIFTHFWSLAVEEQFYLFWPIIIYLLNDKGVKIFLPIVILFSILFRFFTGEALADAEHPGEILYRLTPGQLEAFAIGAIIPVFKLENLRNRNFIAYCSLAPFFVVGVINYLLIKDDHDVSFSSLGYPIGFYENYQFVWSYTLINMASFGLILMLLNPGPSNQLSRLLSSNLMVQIGKVSYGMYVYHWVILAAHRKFINPLIHNPLLSFIVYLALTYLISYVSFITLEKYFLKLKNKKFSLKKVYKT